MRKICLGLMFCSRPVAEEWERAVENLLVPKGCAVRVLEEKNKGNGNNFSEVIESRINLVTRARREKADYLFFIDDDVVVPPDSTTRLLEGLRSNPLARVCGGLYRRKNSARDFLVWDREGKPAVHEGLFSCQAVGGGCMLIDLSVFDSPFPTWQGRWFSLPGQDDIFFCQQVVHAGFLVLAHSEVRCDHLDTVRGVAYRASGEIENLRERG